MPRAVVAGEFVEPDGYRHFAQLATGAARRGVTAADLLITGPPGVGKTRVAAELCKAYSGDVSMHVLYPSQALARVSEVLQSLNSRDFLFLDEAHLIESNKEVLEILLRLETGELYDAKRNHVVALPPFTLILATDQPRKIPKAIRDRATNTFAMSPYSEAKMEKIVLTVAAQMRIPMRPRGARLLAKASAGIPRLARNLLHSYVDWLATRGVQLKDVTINHNREFLSSAGYDADVGLSARHREYLFQLAHLGRASTRTLASSLGLSVQDVLDAEMGLIPKKMIRIHSNGRELSNLGQAYIASYTTGETDEFSRFELGEEANE